jgi:signal transduction histidine kinase
MAIKDYFLNLSLNKKLTVIMVFLSFILIIILQYLYAQSEEALLNELENQTAELSKAIQVGVEEVTSRGYTDEMRLQNYLKKLNAKGIKEISIISNTDEIVSSTNPQKIGQDLSPTKKERIIKAELGEPVSKEGKVYNVILPVVAGNEHYGYIHLKINSEDFSKILRANAIKRTIATTVVFGIGIVISLFLSWMYTRPIKSVVDAVKRVAAGDLSINLRTNRKDEVGELTNSFNFMVERLRERSAIEEKLREAEHLSGIVQLAKSVAHEIRNPLNFINLSIDHIRNKYLPLNERDRRDFEDMITSIKNEIQRLNGLVGNFLDYGKSLKLSVQKTNLVLLIQDVISLISARAEKEHVKIFPNIESLPEVCVDPEFIKTCLLNVILNSFQAMPDGGNLFISSYSMDGKVFITIEDTGLGVSKENIQKIFDPFFSTKNDGLGLGLAMTKRIIEEHGGKITFESVEGKGSKVTLILPVKNVNSIDCR